MSYIDNGRWVPKPAKIHYGIDKTLCKIENSGSTNRKMTIKYEGVTCLICLKILDKQKQVYLDEGMFVI